MQQDGVRTALEQGRWTGRIRARRLSDGVEVPIDMVLGRVDHAREASGLLFGIVQDATEAVEREQQMRRVERLASVGTLIGGVAHELNNPLTAILNFAQLMLLDERSEDDCEALGIMRREASRMARIVDDLKQIARSTQEKESAKGPVDLNEAVRHVLKVQGYRLHTSGVEVREDLGADLPPVWADRGQIEQIILNLVVNAEQAMMAGGGEGRRLILRTRRNRMGAALHVVDNGPGIPAEDLERIFDPFWTTKAPGEGTGLGLSLVQSIVGEHGGQVRVESEVGRGASFRVELPRAVTGGTLPGESSHPEPCVRPLRILVVDDEAAIRRAMTLFLGRRGNTVDEATDGRAALRLLEERDYDVILSDLRMPGLGGDALLAQLRERGLADRLILMTGEADGGASRLADEDVPVLLKPLDLSQVARAVEGHARGE